MGAGGSNNSGCTGTGRTRLRDGRIQSV